MYVTRRFELSSSDALVKYWIKNPNLLSGSFITMILFQYDASRRRGWSSGQIWTHGRKEFIRGDHQRLCSSFSSFGIRVFSNWIIIAFYYCLLKFASQRYDSKPCLPSVRFEVRQTLLHCLLWKIWIVMGSVIGTDDWLILSDTRNPQTLQQQWLT